MEDFIANHKNEFLYSLITFLLVLAVKYLFTRTARKVGKIGEFNPVRTNLIIKYISILLTLTSFVVLTLIWGVNYKEVGVLLSSVFAVIGVALFAQWSILSNITAGVIIFFSYPFKIGNTIKILDKELTDSENPDQNSFIIEDIRAFHMHLRKSNGEILTYPNSLILQKGVTLVATYNDNLEEGFNDK
ncbi:MAG: mechanosensitive ion channel domain-containing protein [Maribacter sp.]|jgi:small-conductance mechanosensitive channel